MEKINKEVKDDDPRPCSFFWDEEDKTLSLRFYDKDNVYAIADYTLSKEDTADLYKFLRNNYAVSLRNNLGKDDSVSDNKNHK
jgi:hypothetical protein